MLSTCVHDLECEEYMVYSIKVDKQIFMLEINQELTLFNVTAIHEIKGKIDRTVKTSILQRYNDIRSFSYVKNGSN